MSHFVSTTEKGQYSEAVAAEYLEKQGHTIVARNLRTPFGEIDLLTKHKGDYVCVEVRSHSNSQHVGPELSITYTKYRHLVRSLLSLDWLYNKPVRIDFITVVAGTVFRYYKDIRLEHVITSKKLPYTY